MGDEEEDEAAHHRLCLGLPPLCWLVAVLRAAGRDVRTPCGSMRSSMTLISQAWCRHILVQRLAISPCQRDAPGGASTACPTLAPSSSATCRMVRDGFADAATNAVLAKLVRSLNDEEGQIVLILEDYHSAECDAVNAIVKRLIRDTLSQFTIFIDSRRQPNIYAFSLIASGDAIEIDAQQLRLTKAETLLALRDVTDDNSGLEIYDQTEGWPVAVQLARVQRRNAPDEPILAGVDGGLIASYLTEQVLSTLDDDTQELLLTLAFLERFNPELVNFVLDSPKAWGRIDSLSSFAALIVPLVSSTLLLS